MLVQGSPNLNLTVTNTDVYIDNKLAFSNFFYPFAAPVPAVTGPIAIGPVTPFIELPLGKHDFRLVQHGTTAPTFLEAVINVANGSKQAIVAEGDAAYVVPTFAVWTLPVYTTPAGIRATSVLNASPNAGSIDVWYTCPAPALCGDGVNTGTALSTGRIVGTLAAPSGSWTNNALLKSSTTGSYCFGAYPAGSAGPPLPFVNAAAGPPFATFPVATADDPRNVACVAAAAIGPGTDTDFIVMDAPSVAPRLPAHGPSSILAIPDANG